MNSEQVADAIAEETAKYEQRGYERGWKDALTQEADRAERHGIEAVTVGWLRASAEMVPRADTEEGK